IGWEHLKPAAKGMAVMVRDRKASYDGWVWSAIAWGGWQPDWPADAGNPIPFSRFGQYCTNCHASTGDSHTFSARQNSKRRPGEPLVFLSQNFFLDPSWRGLHERIVQSAAAGAPELGKPPPYDPAFTRLYWSWGGPPPELGNELAMTSETYDNVWVKAGEPTA